MSSNIIVLLDNQTGRKMVKDACKANSLDYSEFENLLNVEVEQAGKQRRIGLWNAFDTILDRIRIAE